MGVRWWRWMPFRPPLLPPDEPTSIKLRGWYKYIDFYINLLNLTKPCNSGLKKWMHKAARHSDGVDSLNPRGWRGKLLYHHGGGVCWLFVLLWMDSWCHELIVCKKLYKNNLKMRLTALLFDPPRRATHQEGILPPLLCDVQTRDSNHHVCWCMSLDCLNQCLALTTFSRPSSSIVSDCYCSWLSSCGSFQLFDWYWGHTLAARLHLPRCCVCL